MYTSGSTGSPKGVMLDHANLEAMTTSMGDHIDVGEDDHCLLVLPLFHVNAIVVSTLTPLSRGGRMTVVGTFRPARSSTTSSGCVRRTSRPCRRSMPCWPHCPTTYARHLVAAVRRLRRGAGLCRAAGALRGTLRIHDGGGLRPDGGTCASACNPITGVRKLGTVGPSMPGQQIRIAGPDGEDVPTGQTGEVLISGPTVMRGYLGKPEATAETIVDGWLHTGDVADSTTTATCRSSTGSRT
nr:AMP-binding protein [Aeromicrobium sp. A1-2]